MPILIEQLNLISYTDIVSTNDQISGNTTATVTRKRQLYYLHRLISSRINSRKTYSPILDVKTKVIFARYTCNKYFSNISAGLYTKLSELLHSYSNLLICSLCMSIYFILKSKYILCNFNRVTFY